MFKVFKKIKIAGSDMMATAGLLLLGHGLFLFKPWVSFSVVGALLLIGGAMRGRSEALRKIDPSNGKHKQ